MNLLERLEFQEWIYDEYNLIIDCVSMTEQEFEEARMLLFRCD